jgi:hypothetical protein
MAQGHNTGSPSWGSLKWGSKIWSWVLQDFDPTVTALAASPRSNCTTKLQTHPVIKEGSPHQETEHKNLVMGFKWEPDTKTDRLTIGPKLTSTSTAGSKSEALNVLTPHSLLRSSTGKSYRYQHFGWASCTYPENYAAPHPKYHSLCTPGRVDL